MRHKAQNSYEPFFYKKYVSERIFFEQPHVPNNKLYDKNNKTDTTRLHLKDP